MQDLSLEFVHAWNCRYTFAIERCRCHLHAIKLLRSWSGLSRILMTHLTGPAGVTRSTLSIVTAKWQCFSAPEMGSVGS